MTVRPYGEADFESLVSLFTSSVHILAAPHYDVVQRAAWARQPPDRERWRKRLATLRTLIAEAEHQSAGFVSYDDRGHIDLLYTAPGFQRRGVASLLYLHVERALRSSGVSELFTEASVVAHPFFEHQGFRVVEEQAVDFGGVSFRRYLMCKSIVVAE